MLCELDYRSLAYHFLAYHKFLLWVWFKDLRLLNGIQIGCRDCKEIELKRMKLSDNCAADFFLTIIAVMH